MITVLSWYWSGGVYRPEHVNILAAMVRRNCSLEHRFACVTDTPEGIDPGIAIIQPPRDFEAVRIPTWKEGKRPQCFRRLAMFRPDAAEIFGERIVCMDLDCVVGASLDPLFDVPEDFRICAGTAPGRPYNGSMMILTAGSRPQVYTDFTPERAVEAGQRYLGSDQAWLAHIVPGEATWGEADGVTFLGLGRSPETVRRVQFYAGSKKPWHRLHDPWVRENYREAA